MWPMKSKGYLTLDVIDHAGRVYASKSVDHPAKPEVKNLFASCFFTFLG